MRLTIYFDQHSVKVGKATTSDSREIGYSTSMVCMANTLINTSSGLNVINESGTGIENMVIQNLSNSWTVFPIEI